MPFTNCSKASVVREAQPITSRFTSLVFFPTTAEAILREKALWYFWSSWSPDWNVALAAVMTPSWVVTENCVVVLPWWDGVAYETVFVVVVGVAELCTEEDVVVGLSTGVVRISTEEVEESEELIWSQPWVGGAISFPESETGAVWMGESEEPLIPPSGRSPLAPLPMKAPDCEGGFPRSSHPCGPPKVQEARNERHTSPIRREYEGFFIMKKFIK